MKEDIQSAKKSEIGTPRRSKGRPRNFDREAALEKAMLLFWRKGYTATSMNDLTSSMGITPPSLYSAFESKQALYLEALNYYQQRFTHKLWAEFDKASTAREAVEVYLTSLVALFSSVDKASPSWCMLALSTVGEEGYEYLGNIVRETRAKALQRLEKRLDRAVNDGELTKEKVVGLARFILAVQGGISIQARDGASTSDLKNIVKQTLSIWDKNSPE